MENTGIEHVSDTALWVAAYRALESKRPDAVFRDPLAEKLVGERGRRIAASMPMRRAVALAMVIRTAAIDRLVHAALAQGVDTVVNLGAGLDTRPYRMSLPRSLRWVEVDFPRMIDYKNERLSSDTPVCDLRRIAADLSNDSERSRLLARLGQETRNALIITEGVIPYLTDDQAARLSKDLVAMPPFRFWVMDYKQGGLKTGPTRFLSRKLKKSPFLFGAKDVLGFFESHGWAVEQDIHMLDEGKRIGRPLTSMAPPWSWALYLAPARLMDHWNRTFGYVMFRSPAHFSRQDQGS